MGMCIPVSPFWGAISFPSCGPVSGRGDCLQVIETRARCLLLSNLVSDEPPKLFFSDSLPSVCRFFRDSCLKGRCFWDESFSPPFWICAEFSLMTPEAKVVLLGQYSLIQLSAMAQMFYVCATQYGSQ